MALVRLNDFLAGTPILDSAVDAEFNQLVGALNGVDAVEILHRFSHATTPVVNINQVNTAITALLLRGQQNAVDTLKMKANGYIVGYPKCIHQNNTTIGNVGAGLDALRSFDLPINTLAADGDFIRIVGGGVYANTEANKQIQLTINGNLVISFGATIDLENGAWYADHMLVRLGTTTVRDAGFDLHSHARMSDGALVTTPSGFFLSPRGVSPITVLDLTANTNTIQFSGEGSADNDVIQQFFQVWACQMS